MASSEMSQYGKGHQFGGDWTTRKLEVLKGYLSAYNIALREKPSPQWPFERTFIDAFAGTGYRQERRRSHVSSVEDKASLLFPDLAAKQPQDLLDGSARIALKTEPRFNKYIFVERSADRCRHLEGLREEFPQLAADIDIRLGDANAEIQDLCLNRSWRSHRAVLLLDPYGMQVDWKTIEAVAGTKAIDLWLLFPLGMGVNRLLPRNGEVPEAWRRRLDALLGTTDWYDEFYKVERTADLFGDQAECVVKATMETIGKYFTRRLSEVFAGVAEPGVLHNSSNNPLYLFCFAVGNENGKPTALRIANHMLRNLK